MPTPRTRSISPLLRGKTVGGDRRRRLRLRRGRRGAGAWRRRPSICSPAATRSPRRRSPGRAAFPAPMTIITNCPTPTAGIRRSGSAAPAPRRPPTRSSAPSNSPISICIFRALEQCRRRATVVETTINGTTYHFDFVIAGTGYSADIAARPELRDFAGQNPALARSLHTSAGGAGRHAGRASLSGRRPRIAGKDTPARRRCSSDIHVQNPSGFVSFGLPIGDVPSMKRDIPVIVGRISADLFRADLDTLRRRMTGDVPPDFTDALWRSAVT